MKRCFQKCSEKFPRPKFHYLLPLTVSKRGVFYAFKGRHRRLGWVLAVVRRKPITLFSLFFPPSNNKNRLNFALIFPAGRSPFQWPFSSKRFLIFCLIISPICYMHWIVHFERSFSNSAGSSILNLLSYHSSNHSLLPSHKVFESMALLLKTILSLTFPIILADGVKGPKNFMHF